jgi:hypothetical protein
MWLVCSTAIAQEPSEPSAIDPAAEYPEAISFFAPFFFPKILQDEYRLKEYICSDEFAPFRQTHGDARATDALFRRALTLSWNNVYEALLISFVCTMEHRNFGVKLPLVGPLLWLPLTSEFPDEFRQRVRALPSKLYADSPPDSAGDRDKLQHFFGSALLTYAFESCDVAARVGEFVELEEDRFIVEGSLDQRDIRANTQGQRFGFRLLSNPAVLPSEFLGKVEHRPDSERGCVPGELYNSISSFTEER